MRITSVQSVTLLCALAMAAGGCCNHKAKARDVTVTLDPSLRRADGRLMSVQVDMIAVRDDELAKWTSVPVDTYWQSGGSGLASSSERHTMMFDFNRNDVVSQTLRADDKRWQEWLKKEPTRLVMIARIPGVSGAGGGAADPRRVDVPLDPCVWDPKGGPIDVKVSSTGVNVTTPHAEPK